MNNDLRAQLALRLFVIWKNHPGKNQEPFIDWAAVADECLRQMEWAFDNGWKQGVTWREFSGQSKRPPRDMPGSMAGHPTLAPDDWSP